MNSLQKLVKPWSRLVGAGRGVIGLDLSAERLNLIQFQGTSDAPVLRAAASIPHGTTREQLLADPKALKRLLLEALAAHGFKGRRVMSCLPASELRIFPISVTLTPGADESLAIAADLRLRVGAELETSVVDYMPIRSDDAAPDKRDALVALASRDRVIAYLQALEGAGLEVSAVDIGPAALARLIAHINLADSGVEHPHALALNFGRNRSHISVVWGRRLVLDREIDFSEAAVLSRVARAISVDEAMAQRLLLEKGVDPAGHDDALDADTARTLAEVLRPEFAALVAEINKTLIYTASRSRGRNVDRVYLLGSAGRYPGVAKLMQGLISIPVDVLNPFRAFRSSMPASELDRIKPIAGVALACGLALRGLPSHA